MLFHLIVIIPNEYYIHFVVVLAEKSGVCFDIDVGKVGESDYVPWAGLEDPPTSYLGILG